ncbi:dTDP-4-dehydrorhamnose reductase [Pelotomaculum sp. PtaB.Bin117]|uniref:dTDP-4-dehydrorhamnose reductase n=1 Tax=Pelotomaculum sp. PtaB.Bin117 TaxID=1811694 RepID=UPI0009C4E147|nr:dTDP-4-dehydrorhamnose reductase [Pelotomaculum sp. PtaB.Bin117]OPX89002.1 MAG: dTDP-4-dehydrorhamnose reductase [Pelotomaculum sp. PtaB.Bin117]
MKVIVTGAAGMLGRQVVEEYLKRGANVVPLTRRELDITDRDAVFSLIDKVGPGLVVNCAAYTNVDGAEEERDKAFAVNGLGPRYLALACRRVNAAIVHISTDYIFDGKAERPYNIYDLSNPINVYGESKYTGEAAVREIGGRFYVVRTSWLFGPGGRNFVDTILKLARGKSELKVVDDQYGTPTYTKDLACLLADLAGTGIYGTYHATNSGATTWFGLAGKVVEVAGLTAEVEPCRTEEYPRPAARPRYSVLNPFPLKQVAGYCLPPWEDAVRRYINHVRNEEY